MTKKSPKKTAENVEQLAENAEQAPENVEQAAQSVEPAPEAVENAPDNVEDVAKTVGQAPDNVEDVAEAVEQPTKNVEQAAENVATGEMTVAEARKMYRQSNKRIVDESISSFMSLRHIDKVYPNGAQAVFDFNLEVDKHDFVALVGPSGCGKSTTLRMIAGLEEITAGKLYIDGVLSNYLPSKDRDIAMVFQNYALYPQLNVYDNIAFGLRLRKTDKKEIEKRVFEAADILDLGQFLDRKPKQLSGGQMQRVALGRAIVRKAKLFLMDEPLSNLDAKLRVQMRSEIVRIHEEVGATTVYVTHDQTEAMTMANKIVVMNKGFVQQVGSPLEIYGTPATLFVATFIGTPPMNILDAEYDNGVLTLANGKKIELPERVRKAHDAFMLDRKREVDELLSRADEAELTELKNYVLPMRAYRNEQSKKATVEAPKKLGFFGKLRAKFVGKKKKAPPESKDEYIGYLREMSESYAVSLAGKHGIKVGIRPEDLHITDGEDGIDAAAGIVEILGSEFIVYAKSEAGQLVIKSQSAVMPHSAIKVSVDAEKLHLFDATSERNIMFDRATEADAAAAPRKINGQISDGESEQK